MKQKIITNKLSVSEWITNYLIKYDNSNEFPSKKIKIFSLTYNIMIPLIAFVLALFPIFISIVNENIMSRTQFGIFFLITLIYMCVSFIDWIFFISVSKTYYGVDKYSTLFKKLGFNVIRLLQVFACITTFVLSAIYLKTSSEHIFLIKTKNISINIMQIIMFLLLLCCASTFFQRLLVNVVNSRKLGIFKVLLFKRLYSFLISIILVVALIFIFAYIIFLTQFNDKNNEVISWTYWRALWFCFVTITTIGYGDVVVSTALGKVFTVPLAIVGIILYGFISANFVSIINDYNQIKDDLRKAAKHAKQKQNEQEKMLKQINNIILLNLYKAKIIDKKTYDNLLKYDENIEKIISDDSIMNDIEIKNEELFFKNKKMGNRSTKKTISYMAVFTKPETKNIKLMKKEDATLIKKILKSEKSIYFDTDLVDNNISNIVLFTKKPYRLAYCELEVAGSFILNKNDAWGKYGAQSDLTKEEFDEKFENKKEIRIFIIKNKYNYETPLLLETFGIYSNSRISNYIYLS